MDNKKNDPKNHKQQQIITIPTNNTNWSSTDVENCSMSLLNNFGHILMSNYANYAKMRFFQDVGSIANASTHYKLA